MVPDWARYLGRALWTNGLRRHGSRISSDAHAYDLGNWWFNYPARAARRWRYGIRQHGVRRWIELSRESWRFTREWRRRS